MNALSERAQPVDDGAGTIRGPYRELTPNADADQHLAHRVAGRHRPARFPKKHRQKYRHARGGDAIGESNYERMQSRHLMHDNDRGTAAAPIDFSRPATVIEIK